jgi:hypothetical protein
MDSGHAESLASGRRIGLEAADRRGCHPATIHGCNRALAVSHGCSCCFPGSSGFPHNARAYRSSPSAQ